MAATEAAADRPRPENGAAPALAEAQARHLHRRSSAAKQVAADEAAVVVAAAVAAAAAAVEARLGAQDLYRPNQAEEVLGRSGRCTRIRPSSSSSNNNSSRAKGPRVLARVPAEEIIMSGMSPSIAR